MPVARQPSVANVVVKPLDETSAWWFQEGQSLFFVDREGEWEAWVVLQRTREPWETEADRGEDSLVGHAATIQLGDELPVEEATIYTVTDARNFGSHAIITLRTDE